MFDPGAFAAIGLTLYATHHVGDYWVQTDYQARHKGDHGARGRFACLAHALTYTATQGAGLAVLALLGVSMPGIFLALAVSAVTHWMADRRELGIMFALARSIPGKAAFMRLGVPRSGRDDNPSLGTGAWALDQSWHIFWGVWVAAIVAALPAAMFVVVPVLLVLTLIGMVKR